jgi:AAA family ATP:ADP antiporter
VQYAVDKIGTNNLLLVSAGGFVVTAVLVLALAGEKRRLTAATGEEAQKTTLDRNLGGNPFDGFVLLFKSPYLLMIALFLLLMTTISTVIYFQLSDTITHLFASRAERTRVFATIDFWTNTCAVVVQLLGTGRIISRFGVTFGLLLNPVIMVLAFLAVVFSPVLTVLGVVQVVRRFSEYAVAKPSRDMLFTVVDQQSKYKAKNVIDTVVYRFGDLASSWLSAAILPFGVPGLAILGVVASVVWFPIAWVLGRRYESARGAGEAPTEAVASH